MSIPNTRIPFTPDLFVTIVAHGTHPNPIAVLVQGFVLTLRTLPVLIATLRVRLRVLRENMMSTLAAAYEDPDDVGKGTVGTIAANVTPDLSGCLRNAALALKVLPKEACPIVVLVTDGVLGPPSMHDYDNLIMQFNRHSISINAIQITGSDAAFDRSDMVGVTASLGFVDNSKSIRFMCAATGGTLLDLPVMTNSMLDASYQNMIYRTSDTKPNRLLFCLLWRFSHVMNRMEGRKCPDYRRGGLGRYGSKDPFRARLTTISSNERNHHKLVSRDTWNNVKRLANRRLSDG